MGREQGRLKCQKRAAMDNIEVYCTGLINGMFACSLPQYREHYTSNRVLLPLQVFPSGWVVH